MSKIQKIQLNLYRIIFNPATGIDINRPLSNTVPLGFAFVLAVGPETAKQQWIEDSVETYMIKYPSIENRDIVRTRWAARWAITERIDGPFKNGYVICNTANGPDEPKEV